MKRRHKKRLILYLQSRHIISPHSRPLHPRPPQHQAPAQRWLIDHQSVKTKLTAIETAICTQGSQFFFVFRVIDQLVQFPKSVRLSHVSYPANRREPLAGNFHNLFASQCVNHDKPSRVSNFPILTLMFSGNFWPFFDLKEDRSQSLQFCCLLRWK